MPAIFRMKKREKDHHWVTIFPNFSWKSTNENTGVKAPDVHNRSGGDVGAGVIHIKFLGGLLECSSFTPLNAKFPGFDIAKIVEARLKTYEGFGVMFDYEHVVTEEDLTRSEASETTHRVLRNHAELVKDGASLDEIEGWLAEANRMRKEGYTLGEALAVMKGDAKIEDEDEDGAEEARRTLTAAREGKTKRAKGLGGRFIKKEHADATANVNA